eukprot:jgi/Bigna1/136138/aug1.32_g10846
MKEAKQKAQTALHAGLWRKFRDMEKKMHDGYTPAEISGNLSEIHGNGLRLAEYVWEPQMEVKQNHSKQGEWKFFSASSGLEVPAVTREEMLELDRIAMEETGPNLFQMMENAGRNLAEEAISKLLHKFDSADLHKARVVVLAGSGGNGGGGICAARHLANRGVNVRLCLSSPDNLKEVPKHQRMVYGSTSGLEVTYQELKKNADISPDLILDAIIGYSLKGKPRGLAQALIQWANDTRSSAGWCKILSLDVPSGLDCTEGTAPGDVVRADNTVTLALPKIGLNPKSYP